MSQENVQFARKLYDAFNSGDLDTFSRGLSNDLIWNEADNSLYSAGNPYRSFAAVLDGVFKPTERDFASFRCDLEQLIDGGEFVIGTGRYRGKCKATGTQAATQFCHLLRFDKDGKLDRVQEYADTWDEALVTGRVQQAAPEMKVPQPAM